MLNAAQSDACQAIYNSGMSDAAKLATIGQLTGWSIGTVTVSTLRTRASKTTATATTRTRSTRRQKASNNGLNKTAAKVLNAIPITGATKKQIATAAGVSQASVTRTLNGSLKPYVTESGGRWSPNEAMVQQRQAA